MKRKKRGSRLLILKNLKSSYNMKIPSLSLAATSNSSTKALRACNSIDKVWQAISSHLTDCKDKFKD